MHWAGNKSFINRSLSLSFQLIANVVYEFRFAVFILKHTKWNTVALCVCFVVFNGYCGTIVGQQAKRTDCTHKLRTRTTYVHQKEWQFDCSH